MRLKILTLTLLIIVLISGCLSIPKPQSTQPNLTSTITPTSTPPTFQPDIWDKPVIRPPPGSPEGRLQTPFEIDINSSYGFERKYFEHGSFGKPVFVLSKGASATIILL